MTTIDSPLALPLSEPSADGEYYKWNLTPKERAHMVSMLGCSADHITLKSSHIEQDRETCSCCGKPTGLDDLVHNALAQGMHFTEFIADVLHNGPKNGSPAHVIHCSGCGTKFGQMHK
ncbi:hypothetical protein BDV19DRAFT_390474 [Aspergillus venezuelensis]